MTKRWIGAGAMAALLGLGSAAPAPAVTVQNLEGLEEIYGRYGPGGDCTRDPRITVEKSGITVETAVGKEKTTEMEWAASYGGNSYEGIGRWIFPFKDANGWPVVFAFSADEKPGSLVVEGHDAGWKGGPTLGARDEALVKGSPYARCP